tara:strand:+ start:308 stop:1000 length:693 start_codon:yes stop_codon:yes gene_type:complete
MIIVLIIFGLITSSKKISLIGVLILIVCSLPIVSDKLVAYLESNYQLSKPSDIKSADAIVVLSGMIRTINSKDGLDYEFGEASDRIFAGINLFKEKKASKIILTRGKLPWSVGIPEGEYLKDIVVKNGISENNILLTENVENTDQEAKAIKKLLSINEPKVILVTSAFHMPRAQIVFEAAGINVVPFPVDFQKGLSKTTFMSFMPSANALSETSFFVREMIGRTYYNLKY